MRDILLLVLIVFFEKYKISMCSTLCKPDQLMRTNSSGNYICCYTVVCQKGQKYELCDKDQGHDTCTNCPDGMYHLDTINTAYMNTILDPCVPKPTCDQPEVKLENGECVCDRSRGYYGNDVNNCLLTEVTCASPGFELKNNGKCEACGEEYFKPEGSRERLCIPKSRCFETQEIDNNGSATEDRACRVKKVTPRTPPATIIDGKHIDSNNKIVVCTEFEPLLKRINVLERRVKRLNRRYRRKIQKDMSLIKNLPMIRQAMKKQQSTSRSGRKGSKKKGRKSVVNKKKSRKSKRGKKIKL